MRADGGREVKGGESLLIVLLLVIVIAFRNSRSSPARFLATKLHLVTHLPAKLHFAIRAFDYE